MDLTIKRESFGQDDRSWLGSAHGTQSTQTITLDVSTFTAADHYPDGWLKSGLPLAKDGDRYVLWTTGNDLAGFLFTTVRVPADTATPVGGALFEHGRVKVDRLPVSVPAEAQDSASGRIIFA